MSRTFKDKNYKWWSRYHPDHWRLQGYPPAIAGAWNGLTRYANRRNRQQRQWWRMALWVYQQAWWGVYPNKYPHVYINDQNELETECGYYDDRSPYRPFPVRNVKWDIY